MPIIAAPQDLLESEVYIDLERMLGRKMYMKTEGLNFGGSIKLRSAVGMVAAAERDGLIRSDSIIVESSSGNLGIALSVVAADKKLRFRCVTDARCNAATILVMRAFGAEVETVTEPHPTGGLLQARLDRVRELCANDPRYVWLDQYGNPANWNAHYETTAPEIAKHVPDLTVLFVGVGTGGTAIGCARYFRDTMKDVRVVAVDAAGSVTFGTPAAPRHIPGLGAGVRPPLVDPGLFDDIVHVGEMDTISACRLMSRHGFLFGGSSGTVLSGAVSWLRRHDPERRHRAVLVAPDMGERYIDTIYSDAWVQERFGRPVPPFVLEEDPS
ncbi:2,3-diaminopropionate biosynthesis protein SbnA [Actinoplanes sp. TBRC 11911]|uniref:2,3-diaminopropionate biosynthesis protein SbnA n=1 Tax=Actinoplanes sp. TBRC 11911 TaxID=2729386 RepID=UPI00145E6C23|nr:2,3-diaminopropionate biosynthesis protein SbnA [Actinoplanes sp. TBRC 11911]NMO53364.1 2,3-diaminopropionate biosynthesis protein SbnA [Actinoplanes sp. TBRC 11911]